MRTAGRKIDPADLPPPLEWETPLWTLYERLATQLRYSFGGLAGMDYTPFIAAIGARGWCVELCLELLGVIEDAILDYALKQRSESG